MHAAIKYYLTFCASIRRHLSSNDKKLQYVVMVEVNWSRNLYYSMNHNKQVFMSKICIFRRWSLYLVMRYTQFDLRFIVCFCNFRELILYRKSANEPTLIKPDIIIFIVCYLLLKLFIPFTVLQWKVWVKRLWCFYLTELPITFTIDQLDLFISTNIFLLQSWVIVAFYGFPTSYIWCSSTCFINVSLKWWTWLLARRLVQWTEGPHCW